MCPASRFKSELTFFIFLIFSLDHNLTSTKSFELSNRNHKTVNRAFVYHERILLEKQMKYVDGERYAAFDFLQNLFDNADEMCLKKNI